jgi:predicted dienelactone hydrolase
MMRDGYHRRLLTVWLACSWLAVAPVRSGGQQPAAGSGPHKVQTVEGIILEDKNRQKDLPVAACLPEKADKCPVIVFSHGAGGSHHYLLPLARFWASHGYVCLLPTHGDSVMLRGGGDFDRPRLRRASDPLTDWKTWQDRPRDVSFLLDSLAELEDRVSALKGKMEAARIGVAGHSLGAYTAQLAAGATIDLPGGEKGRSFADARIRAVLLLSGQGVGQQGLTESSWQKLKLPMMSVTGSLDPGAKGQPPEWRMDPFKHSPPGDKYQLFIEGAQHNSFTGGPGPGIASGDPSVVFDHVKTSTLAFWNAYLKHDESAKHYLQSDALERSSKKTVKLYRK